MNKKIKIFLVAFILIGCNPSAELQPNSTTVPTEKTVSTATTEPTPEATPMVIPEGSFRGFWEPEPITRDWQKNKDVYGDNNNNHYIDFHHHVFLHSIANHM